MIRRSTAFMLVFSLALEASAQTAASRAAGAGVSNASVAAPFAAVLPAPLPESTGVFAPAPAASLPALAASVVSAPAVPAPAVPVPVAPARAVPVRVARAVLRDDVDYERRLTDMTRVELRTALSELSAEQRRLLTILAEAAPHVNAIYQRQSGGPSAPKTRRALERSRDPRAPAARELFERNMGPYDPTRSNEPLFNVPPKPASGFAYPEGMTKDAFDAYLAAHPEKKAALYSPYASVVRGPRGTLRARPYHKAFAKDVAALGKILRRAARAARHPGLKAFLSAKARGLLADDYDESYGLWVGLKDAPVDLVIGPAESYDDSITNAKQSYAFAAYTRDEKGESLIAALMGKVVELARELPVSPELNPYLRDPGYRPTANMISVNMAVHGGDSVTGTAAGWALPGEADLVAKHGTKMLLIRNVIEARGSGTMSFLMKELFGRDYRPDSFYASVAGHELAHGILPMTEGFDPQGRPLHELLGDLTMPLEEQKADLLGLVLLDGLSRRGGLSREAYLDAARVYVADMIHTTYRDPGDAHAKFQVVAYNLLKERGAFSYDEKTGRLTLSEERYPEAMREVAGLFLSIQGAGDRAAAEALLKDKAAVPPEIARAFDRLKAAGFSPRTSFTATLVE